MPPSTNYPDHADERNRWILLRRGNRPELDSFRPGAFFLEEERAGTGDIVPVAAVFLTNRECPWHCVMCDLWKYTLTETVPLGAIPAQIDYALDRLKRGNSPADSSRKAISARHLKLYNSGSFFDPRAIPPADYPAIADRICGFERVIVECHPALIGDSVLRFRDLLAARAAELNPGTGKPPVLEVAMGLETAHPGALEKLNKHLTLERFERACRFLRREGIDTRVFILVQPPFLPADEAPHWVGRSLDFAFDRQTQVAVLIPTRIGNGAMEALAEQGLFTPPTLTAIEAAMDYGLRLRRGRVFADLWDLEKISTCVSCYPARAVRLAAMNRRQELLPAVCCDVCGGGEPHFKFSRAVPHPGVPPRCASK